MRTSTRAAAALAAGSLLAAGAVATATGAGAVTPLSTLHVTSNGHTFAVSGPHRIQAGLVKVAVTATTGAATAGLVRPTGGWTYATYVKARKQIDSELNSNPQQALKELNVALKHLVFYGGAAPAAGRTVSMTAVLTPGTYWLYNDNGAPTQSFKITVFGPTIARSGPTPTATVIAKPTNRFGGASVLPAHGTIRFANHSTYTPHFLVLQHVKEGTTRAEIKQGLESNGPPSFALRGTAATDPVSPGYSQTLTYALPRGEYVEMCFFPDPKTGMPHAFMGMFRLVHLQ